MTTAKITKSVCAALLFCPLSILASTQNPALSEQRDSTMNALDYVLQRPNPNPRFETKKFGDHLFLSGSVGADWMRSNDGATGISSETGMRAEVSVGDWVTPVHGWRFTLGAGRHSGVGGSKPYFLGASIDYMMNLSALVRGENPSRRFEIMALGGVELEALHKSGEGTKMAAGLRVGFQPRLYLSNTTYLFLEPRFGFYSDNLDFATTWHRFDWNASLLIGLGYRINPRPGFHIDNSLFDSERFSDNMFISVSGGLSRLMKNVNDNSNKFGALGAISIGKWFTPSSGLRLTASGTEVKEKRYDNRIVAIGDIDYLWNLNSTLNGFDPDRKIEGNVVLGVSGAFASGKGKKLSPGVHAGFQGIWNINRHFALYLEPAVRYFGGNVSPSGARRNVLTTLNLGLTYRNGTGSERRFKNEQFVEEDFRNSNKWFFEAVGGVFMRSRVWSSNHTVAIGLGKWFLPESGWRVTGEYDYMSANKYRSLSIGADYLANLTTLAAGFDDERIFDLSAFIGLSAGGAHYQTVNNKFVWGPRAGLRAAFRLSQSLDIVLEPRLQAMRIPGYTRSFTPAFFAQAGLSYKFGQMHKKRGDDGSVLVMDEFNRNFVSASFGPSLFSETFVTSHKTVSWAIDASVGRWFTNVSGVQFGLSYDFIDRYWSPDYLNIGTLHLDYLLNLTTLVTGNTRSRFSLAGLVGLGLGWSDDADNRVSPEFEAGLQFRYRLNDMFHLTFTPTMAFWRPLLNGGGSNSHHFIGVGRMPLGVTYSF